MCCIKPPSIWKFVMRKQKGMATHSSILAWRISGTEEPGMLQSIGLQRVRHNWSNLAHTQQKFMTFLFFWTTMYYLSMCSVCKARLTLCNCMDWSPPGSSVHGIFQARILEWVAISSSGDVPNPGMEPASPALAGWFFITEPHGEANNSTQKKALCQIYILKGWMVCIKLLWYLDFIGY